MPRPDKRRQIMQAAETLFAGGRFHEITTDDVAREARVGKGTIYRYFKDKEDLFFETANNGFDELCQLVREKTPAGASFKEQLGQACVQITEFFRHRQEWFGMMQAQERLLPCLAGRFSKRWLQRRRDPGGYFHGCAGEFSVGAVADARAGPGPGPGGNARIRRGGRGVLPRRGGRRETAGQATGEAWKGFRHMTIARYGWLALAVAAACAGVSCVAYDTARAKDYIGPVRPAAAAIRPGPAPVRTPASKPAPAARGPIEIGPYEAIVMALDNNRQLAVEKYNPPIKRTFEQKELAAFDPV
ncbi:MAG: TetR/AcrR family transcriptional regulator, partial [Planctomycetota bacterium]|nr:TetR/AcrR family transcriptional regulator [Planctomycetota bacterium]